MSKSKKHKKEKRKKEKKEKHEKKKHRKHSKSASPPPVGPSLSVEVGPIVGPAPPAIPTPSMAPMTKEQWEAKQSQIRRVLDPETGRMRFALIKFQFKRVVILIKFPEF
jgi:Nuclear RNA-splicing-associated protein